MRFVYHPLAKEPVLKIEGESYTHLYRSRRVKSTSRLDLRNLKDGFFTPMSMQKSLKNTPF
ncbi:hypothetical protein Kyoto25A_14250 [Helicobacter pylori]